MNAGLAAKAAEIAGTKKAGASVKMHFEMREEAYEKLKTSFDEVRKEIDQGMFGDTPEWRALRKSRSKLFEMGKLIKEELVIVTDSGSDSKETIGGKA